MDAALPVFLAVHRFGLGARPGDLSDPALRADPRGWLKAQLVEPPPLPRLLSGQPSSAAVVRERRARRGGSQEEQKAARQDAQRAYTEEAGRRVMAAALSETPFYERLVRFFGDVLVVSVQQRKCLPLVGPFEREVLRPGVLGRFSDLLVASTHHPAMLVYLDNVRSAGPDSRRGGRTDRGRNENLAREILELHTVGVSSGYTQADVIALANLLTGWSLDLGQSPLEAGEHGFAFVPSFHQPGEKVLMGHRYPEGLAGGEAALRDLARHPSTARQISTRMAQHFISDAPPPEVVDAMCAAWASSGGEIRQVAAAMVDCDAAWHTPLRKIRRPAELLIAAMRALQLHERGREQRQLVLGVLRSLNQMPWAAPSPEGWPDTADAWLDGDALLRRLDLVDMIVAHQQRRTDPVAFASLLLGPAVSPELERVLRGAPDPTTGLALVFASPPFQRR